MTARRPHFWTFEQQVEYFKGAEYDLARDGYQFEPEGVFVPRARLDAMFLNAGDGFALDHTNEFTTPLASVAFANIRAYAANWNRE